MDNNNRVVYDGNFLRILCEQREDSKMKEFESTMANAGSYVLKLAIDMARTCYQCDSCNEVSGIVPLCKLCR